MQIILFLFGLLIVGNCLAKNEDDFKEKFNEIIKQSYENQMKHYLFKQEHNGEELSPTKSIEMQELNCASFLSEFKFYEFTLANIDAYKAHQAKEGFNPNKVSKEKLERDYISAQNRMMSQNLNCS